MTLVVVLVMFSVALIIRSGMESSPCDCHQDVKGSGRKFSSVSPSPLPPPPPRQAKVITLAPSSPSPLSFMKSKLVLLVSHELSLSGFFFLP